MNKCINDHVWESNLNKRYYRVYILIASLFTLNFVILNATNNINNNRSFNSILFFIKVIIVVFIIIFFCLSSPDVCCQKLIIIEKGEDMKCRRARVERWKFEAILRTIRDEYNWKITGARSIFVSVE